MKLEKRVILALTEKNLTLALAESCTGGAIASALVSVPGASRVFLGGVVSYTNAVKQAALGVSAETLARHTAVSAPVAREMAEGARARLLSDIAVSVTGLAGPGGGTAEIPVGRVFLGLATREGSEVRCLTLSGSRRAIRRAAVREALSLILSSVNSNSVNKT
ncbi:MAG: nicotinamide-nucleotide amidohydrolase family protein [Clostridia bacterium]|nr:nicotinamide-nucleotide amidohydrolase family protein [Clostridia bacterium]